jgi:hypothetical protein
VGCALVILTYWVGALQDNARHPGQRGVGDVVYVTFLLGGVWLLGRALRGRGQRAAQLEQHAARLEAEQQAQATVIQAGAAKQLLAETPERAGRPLVTVQDTGRQTITELRRLLGCGVLHEIFGFTPM